MNSRPDWPASVSRRDNLNDRIAATTRSLQLLQNSVARSAARDVEFDETLGWLEALPLTTTEFGLAKQRLRNAKTYWRAGVRGAALYELRILAHVVDRQKWNQ